MNVAMTGVAGAKGQLISDPADIVVFGGSGDLSKRKLLPALYSAELEGRMPPEGRIIAVSRAKQTDESFVAIAEQAIFAANFNRVWVTVLPEDAPPSKTDGVTYEDGYVGGR